MYCLVPEKSLRLAPQGHFLRGVYGPPAADYLAICDTFYEFINIIYTAFLVWLLSLLYALLESLWESRKNKIPRPVSNTFYKCCRNLRPAKL
jgi:hypothetical protein